MTILYADTSAVIRAYLADEDDHEELRELLLEGADPVVTSELTRIEYAAAMTAAQRGLRIPDVSPVLAQFDYDCGEEGRLSILRLAPRVIMPTARQLVTTHHLRTLDAIHLATAMNEAVALAGGEPVAMVTRDQRQAAVAREHGFALL